MENNKKNVNKNMIESNKEHEIKIRRISAVAPVVRQSKNSYITTTR